MLRMLRIAKCMGNRQQVGRDAENWRAFASSACMINNCAGIHVFFLNSLLSVEVGFVVILV